MIKTGLSVAAALLLAACMAPETGDVTKGVPAAETASIYLGAETLLMGPDLITIRARLRGAGDEKQVARYAECVVAGYAVKNGYGFARHIRTNLAEEGGLWRADAVYSITSALPRGLRTIDAEVVAQDCAAERIPMV